MNAGGPYREADGSVLLCPRDGDPLVVVFESVQACARCEGTWLPQRVVDRAFGDPAWPPGANAWWRREIDCPECAATGIQQRMLAITVEHIIVDRCASHGTWLDAGELRRVAGQRGDSDLAILQRRLGLDDAVDLRAWRTSVDARQRDVMLAAYHARKAMLAAAREERERAEQLRQEAERIGADERAQREAQRLTAERTIASLQAELDMLVTEQSRREGEVAVLRATLRDEERALDRGRARITQLRLAIERLRR